MIQAFKKALRLMRYDLPLHTAMTLTDALPNTARCNRIRGMFCRPFFGSCGKRLSLGKHLSIYNAANVHLGSDVYLAHGTVILADEKIHLHDEVMTGPYVVVVSAVHTVHNRSYRKGNASGAPVAVGRGAWLAAHATVSAGVSIGAGALVGANSVVTRNVEAGERVGGVPARPLPKSREYPVLKTNQA